MKHTHSYKLGKSKKIAVCACGKFRHTNLVPGDVITAIDAKARPLGQYLMEANDAYPDNQIENYFDFKSGTERTRPFAGGGDTLALFIGREISDLYDKDAGDDCNRSNMAQALRNAMMELEKIAETIEEPLSREVQP